MNVFLLRHGACEDLRDGMQDSERQLTEEGGATIKKSLPGMRGLIGQVEYVVTSPFARAVQTSEILAEYFKCREFIEAAPALAEQGREKEVNSVINKLIGKDNIVVVGHMPHLGQLAQFWTGDTETPVKLKKGGMAKIYIKGFPGPGEGQLQWVKTSEEIAESVG